MAQRTRDRLFHICRAIWIRLKLFHSAPQALEFRKRFKLNWHKICIKFIIGCWLFQYFLVILFNFCSTNKLERKSTFATSPSWLFRQRPTFLLLACLQAPFHIWRGLQTLKYDGNKILLYARTDEESLSVQSKRTQEKTEDFNFLFTAVVFEQSYVYFHIRLALCIASFQSLWGFARSLYALVRMQI